MKKSPPVWLDSFVNSITPHIHSRDLLSPLGCHFHQAGDVWEVTVFASSTEIVGGPQDGKTTHSRFDVDVKSIMASFSQVTAMTWQAQSAGSKDDLGPHLAIEGLHANRQIWLRITSSAPRKFSVGRRAMVNLQRIEELW